MSTFLAATDWAIDGVDIATDEDSESSWRGCETLTGMSLVTMMTSAGAAELTVTITISHVTPGDEGNHALASFSYAIEVVTSETTKTYKVHDLTDYAIYLDRPFTQYKVKAAVATADATDVYVGVCQNVSG